MTLGAYLGWLGPVTHRQHAAFADWLDREWDRPSRSDHYAMQVSAVVREGHVKPGTKVRTEDFRLKFSPDRPVGDKPGVRDADETARKAAAAWGARLGAVSEKPTTGPGNT